MTFNEIMKELKNNGTEQNIKIYTNHGADLDIFGVSMQFLKKLAKKIKINHPLGMQLLQSKNVDAMYLSRWIVDPNQITIKELEDVLLETNYYILIENAVPYIAASNTRLAFSCIEKWITHKNTTFRQAAYAIYSMLVLSLPNQELDNEEINELLLHIQDNIHNEENRVRYTMNNFVIAVGSSIPSFTELTYQIAENIGKVDVSMGKTACKVPVAKEYIKKIENMGKIGVKRAIT